MVYIYAIVASVYVDVGVCVGGGGVTFLAHTDTHTTIHRLTFSSLTFSIRVGHHALHVRVRGAARGHRGRGRLLIDTGHTGHRAGGLSGRWPLPKPAIDMLLSTSLDGGWRSALLSPPPVSVVLKGNLRGCG